MHEPFHDPLRDFKQLFEDPLFLAKVKSYNRIFAFTPMGASLVDNARIDEQLGKPQASVYIFRVQENMYHPVGTLLPVESEKPSSAQLYIFGSEKEAQINMRCYIMDGLGREIVATIQRVLSQVHSFVLLAREFIRNQEFLYVRLANHEAPEVDMRTHNRSGCQEVAAILLEDNTGAERDIILH